MANEPVTRITFDSGIPAWLVEQRTSALWLVRGVHDNFYRSVFELFRICCTTGPQAIQIESIDLGPVDPQSQLVHRIVDQLEEFIL
jgi:hypothetical protein